MNKKEGINIWWLVFISAILAISMMFYSPIYGLLLLDLMSFSGFLFCAIQIILCIYKLANRSKWQKCTGIVVDKKNTKTRKPRNVKNNRAPCYFLHIQWRKTTIRQQRTRIKSVQGLVKNHIHHTFGEAILPN